MSVRPLPHFSHKPIGKTTHKKGMSYSHVNYITREEACSKTLAQNMPADRDGARPYFEREAYKDGVPANARVADTLIIALPIEMTNDQRHEAVAGFMDKIGHGRIAWLAAFHDKGKDEHNPHCHLIFRDADIETGRKVVGTTTSAKDVREAQEHGWRVPPRMTTKELRVAWCEHLNAEMERHGLDARFDHRTLKDQGIDREPQIHVGPKAMSMAEKNRDFESQDRKRGDHANVYSLLDAGSRAEHNNRIIAGQPCNAPPGSRTGIPTHRSGRRGREGLEKRQLRERQTPIARPCTQSKSATAPRCGKPMTHKSWSINAGAGRTMPPPASGPFKRSRHRTPTAGKASARSRMRPNARRPRRRSKSNPKAAYAQAAKRQIDAARPAKDEAWQKLKLAQEQERKDLSAGTPKRSPRCRASISPSAMRCMSDGSITISPSRAAGASAKLEASRTWRRCNERPSRSSSCVPPKIATATTGSVRDATPSLAVATQLAERGKTEQAIAGGHSRRNSRPSGSSTRFAPRRRRHAVMPPDGSPNAGPPTARKFRPSDRRASNRISTARSVRPSPPVAR